MATNHSYTKYNFHNNQGRSQRGRATGLTAPSVRSKGPLKPPNKTKLCTAIIYGEPAFWVTMIMVIPSPRAPSSLPPHQWRHQGGSTGAFAPPQSEALPHSPPPPSEWPKSTFFGLFFFFGFCPLDAPPPQFSGAATAPHQFEKSDAPDV